MKNLFSITVTLVLVVGILPQVRAHHGTSVFDTKTDISIEGTVVKYEWANPHVYLWVEAPNKEGTLITWEVEGGPPAILRRAGWNKNQLSVGEHVVVNGHPGKNPKRNIILMDTLEKSKGQTIELGQEAAIGKIMQETNSEVATTNSLQGTWGTNLDMTTVQPFLDPSVLTLTELGKAAWEKSKESATRAENSNCDPQSPPGIMFAPDIKVIDIEQDRILLKREWDGVERVIHLNLDSHAGAIASVQGHSIGHFEDNTLIIDTTHFTPQPRDYGSAIPSSSQKHLVERLELGEGGTYLLYSFTLEDPQYLAEPIVAENIKWDYRPDLVYRPEPCDEENARRYLEE